jgi:hypothetical protein
VTRFSWAKEKDEEVEVLGEVSESEVDGSGSRARGRYEEERMGRSFRLSLSWFLLSISSRARLAAEPSAGASGGSEDSVVD